MIFGGNGSEGVGVGGAMSETDGFEGEGFNFGSELILLAVVVRLVGSAFRFVLGDGLLLDDGQGGVESPGGVEGSGSGFSSERGGLLREGHGAARRGGHSYDGHSQVSLEIQWSKTNVKSRLLLSFLLHFSVIALHPFECIASWPRNRAWE